LPDEAAERSRATMWDVVRFSEFHDYGAVIVENVVDVFQWPPFGIYMAG
jgi:DNA (cytosine-5)-methyltransferase 1